MSKVIHSIPGVEIRKAQAGQTYPVNQIPSSIATDLVEWTRLGDDEQYNVILWRKSKNIEVIEVTWNEDTQDWDSNTVTDTEGLNLVVYLP